MVRLERRESTFRSGNIPYDADMEVKKIHKILVQQKAVEVPEEVRRYHDSKIAFIQSVKNHIALLQTNIENHEKKTQAILDEQTATQTQEAEEARALLKEMTGVTGAQEKTIQKLERSLEEQKAICERTTAQLRDEFLEQKKNVQATKNDLVKQFEKYFNDAQFKNPTE